MTLSTDLLKKIKQIQLRTDALATDLLAGLYRSVFKGKGMEFEEVREYQPGDDIRTIDWNVTARMSTPYVKKFREEREMTVMLIVDVSASTIFGSQSKLKSTFIAEMGSVIAFSAIKNQDKIGLILFSDQVDLYLPPKKGTRHVLRIIRELLVRPGTKKKTNLANALAYLGKVQKGRAVCFIVSDFITPSFIKEIAPLVKRHEIIAICVRDPLEKRFPPAGLVHIVDSETGQSVILDTTSKAVLEKMQNDTQQELTYLEAKLNQMGAGWIFVDTSQPYIDAIRKYFKTKQKRIG